MKPSVPLVGTETAGGWLVFALPPSRFLFATPVRHWAWCCCFMLLPLLLLLLLLLLLRILCKCWAFCFLVFSCMFSVRPRFLQGFHWASRWINMRGGHALTKHFMWALHRRLEPGCFLRSASIMAAVAARCNFLFPRMYATTSKNPGILLNVPPILVLLTLRSCFLLF